MKPPIPIIFEDNHLLVVNKPAGLATQGALAERDSVHSELCRYIKHRDRKPGNVFIGIVSRLDASTSGLLVLAKTSKAAARLSAQIRERTIDKRYLALLSKLNTYNERWQTWSDWVYKDDARHRMVVASSGDATKSIEAAQQAELKIRLWNRENKHLAYVNLITGRKHQVRLQSAARGCPLVGDLKYGGPRWNHPGIGLHAASLRFVHPTLREPMAFAIPPPSYWRDFIEQPITNDQLLLADREPIP